jgi:hypothetical protein
MKSSKNKKVSSSFRDPNGFLFHQNGSLYRQINFSYQKNYDYLINSGLYKALVDARLLIPHQEIKIKSQTPNKVYKIIKPESVPFVSYPYEWSFSQLKDAALTTLKIQQKSIKFGMILKDATAYNIQFHQGKPIFIDTLSFEKYQEGQPWIAYRQFCQHFLAPLALAAHQDIRLNQLLKIFIDGLPLDLTSSLLPRRTYLNFSLLIHLHLHAKSQKHFANKNIKTKSAKVSRHSLLGLIDNLSSAISRLQWQPKSALWANYYQETSYSPKGLTHKKELIKRFLGQTRPKTVWDLGANTGLFSRLASNQDIQTISFDIEPLCVEINYLETVKKKEAHLLPLLLDLTNPSPNLGWQNKERISLIERGPADTVFALALIHHLAIANNLPFSKIAEFFSQICHHLIIEFVPKTDSQVKRLLSRREDIFLNYKIASFEQEFKKYFKKIQSVKIKNTQRTLYLMQK